MEARTAPAAATQSPLVLLGIEDNIAMDPLEDVQLKANLLAIYGKIVDAAAAKKKARAEFQTNKGFEHKKLVDEVMKRAPDELLTMTIDERIAHSTSSRGKGKGPANDKAASTAARLYQMPQTGTASKSDVEFVLQRNGVSPAAGGGIIQKPKETHKAAAKPPPFAKATPKGKANSKRTSAKEEKKAGSESSGGGGQDRKGKGKGKNKQTDCGKGSGSKPKCKCGKGKGKGC